MPDNVEIRNIVKLREHFNLEKVIEYYKNGRMLTWLLSSAAVMDLAQPVVVRSLLPWNASASCKV